MKRLSIVLGSVALLAGCGQILGLGDYEVGEETSGSGGTAGTNGGDSGNGGGGNGGDAGNAGTGGGGTGGSAGADGGMGGVSTTTSGGGDAGTGGGGTTSTSTTGMGGSAGAGPCECDTRNPCLTGECDEVGVCIPREIGDECLSGNFGGVCDDTQQCVPCVDDAPDTGVDSGCPETAPECDDSGAAPECTGCTEDIDCDDDLDCTADSCDDGGCLHSVLPAGAECPDGVCNGAGASDSCVTCVDNEATAIDAGCDAALPWCDATQSPAVCVECLAAEDCDDDNECTTDTCEAKQCGAETVAAGEPCLGGVCSGVPGMEACGDCLDTAAGSEVDQGCTAEAPVCDMNQVPPACTCTDDADCDDQIDCTTDTCNDSQVCVHEPDHGACAASGDVCNPNQCVPGMGCTPVDVTQTQQLLADPAFDAFTSVWTEYSSTDYDLIVSESATLPAYSSPRYAWLGGIEYEYSELYQTVALPEGTQSLTLSFYYFIDTYSIPYDDYNVMGVQLWSGDASSQLHEFQRAGNQDGNNGWTLFEGTVDATAWAGTEVQVYFWASIGAGYDVYYGYPDYRYINVYNTNYFVDSTALTATVCQ